MARVDREGILNMRLATVCRHLDSERPWLLGLTAYVKNQLMTAQESVAILATLNLKGYPRPLGATVLIDPFSGMSDSTIDECCKYVIRAVDSFDRTALDAYRQHGAGFDDWYPIAEKVLLPDLLAAQMSIPPEECVPGSQLLEKHHEAVVEHYILSEDKVISDIGAHIMQTGRWP